MIRLRVRLPADPEEAEIEQPEGGGEGALEGHPLELEMERHPLPGPGQPTGDLQHPIVLRLVPLRRQSGW